MLIKVNALKRKHLKNYKIYIYIGTQGIVISVTINVPFGTLAWASVSLSQKERGCASLSSIYLPTILIQLNSYNSENPVNRTNFFGPFKVALMVPWHMIKIAYCETEKEYDWAKIYNTKIK